MCASAYPHTLTTRTTTHAESAKQVAKHPLGLTAPLISGKNRQRYSVLRLPSRSMAWVDATLRMGRQPCDRAASERDTDWLEHLRGIHMALCTVDIPIVAPHCRHDLASRQEAHMNRGVDEVKSRFGLSCVCVAGAHTHALQKARTVTRDLSG